MAPAFDESIRLKGAKQMREETKKAADELREWFSRRGFDRGETKLAAKRILELMSYNHSARSVVTQHISIDFDLKQAKLCGVYVRDALYFTRNTLIDACQELTKTYKLIAVRVAEKQFARAIVIAEYDTAESALSNMHSLNIEASPTRPSDDAPLYPTRADPFFEARDRFTGYYVLDPDGERVALDTADTSSQVDR
jgi:hypothetical protein